MEFKAWRGRLVLSVSMLLLQRLLLQTSQLEDEGEVEDRPGHGHGNGLVIRTRIIVE